MEEPKIPPGNGVLGGSVSPAPAQQQVVSPVQVPGVYGNAVNVVMTPSNGSATAGMVLGIISIVFSVLSPLSYGMCCFISIPMAIIGVILSHVGQGRAKEIGGVGSGNAVAGLVLNYIQIGIAVLLLILLMVGISVPLAADL